MIDYAATRNLPEAFFVTAAERPTAPFLGVKRKEGWHTTDWGSVAQQVSELSRGLRALGVEPGDRVAIIAENRPEWAIADLAIMAAGAISVPAYTTNTVDDHLHVLSDSGAKLAIVSTARLAKNLIPAAKRAMNTDIVVAIEPVASDEQGIHIVGWEDTLQRGRDMPDDVAERIATIDRTTTSCIIYTSGTGGRPKGVMLSHGAILCNCKGAYDLVSAIPGFEVGAERFLSFLPLSHSYEHTAGLMFPITIGAQIYYAEGVDRLVNNMAEISPTIMTAVPRLYEAIHARIMRGCGTGRRAEADHVHQSRRPGPQKA